MVSPVVKDFGKVNIEELTANIVYSPAKIVSRTYLCQPNNSVIDTISPTLSGWKHNVDNAFMFGVTSTATNAYFYQVIPEPIDGATMLSVKLNYRINGSVRTPGTNRLNFGVRRQLNYVFTAGTPPMVMTMVTAYGTTGVGAVVSTQNPCDPSASLIDRSGYIYYLVVQEESGGGAIAGNNVYSFTINYSVPSLNP